MGLMRVPAVTAAAFGLALAVAAGAAAAAPKPAPAPSDSLSPAELAAQEAAQAKAAAAPPTPLSGLTVAVPATAPIVAASFPSAGATIAGGTLILKVVFDQNMDADAFNYAKAADGDLPECLAKPRLLRDERTFVLLCRVLRGKTYAVKIGGDGGFASVGHRTAEPYELKFSTSMAEPVLTIKDAMTAAGLKDDDGPIVTVEEASAR